MNILVSGGLGYIGSNTVIELLSNNHSVVIVDNLYNSQIDTKAKIETIANEKVDFYEIDVTNYSDIKNICKKYKFDGIVHFAGYKAVGESINKPLKYYENNLCSTINLARIAL
ncbi:MAG: SDR family NAD(P)-dependent oxidoreductase, partial [Acholeplasmataceae bacterium]|nr:SDR family NAD(P)-dependent oxidoreductase [Acholeplasmataceae bacterium]